MQMASIVLVLSSAALSLTLTACAAWSAPQQAEEQRGEVEKPNSSGGDAKKMIAKSKIAADPNAESFAPPARGLTGLGKEFVNDQVQIWSSPAKIRRSDMQWLVPLSGITAGLLVTDSDFSGHLSKNPTTVNHYKTLSNAGVGALIGGAGGMWLLGHVRHNEHWSETGFLAGEAALNSLVAVEAFKYSLRRQRPYQGDGSGPFFQGGGTSFPSEHAAAAWSVAGVVAHEYPGPLVKIAAYGLASLVDYSRIHGRQHFPSDVFVGSIVGNLIAQNVYSRHHDPELGGSAWESVSSFIRRSETTSSANLGSPSVPVDSWIYPAFERLIALGYVDSAFLDMRPWTRFECARILVETGEGLASSEVNSKEAVSLYSALQNEFRQDVDLLGGGNNLRAQADSVYSRATGISGKPLAQGYEYNFGQTRINDQGRPYEHGFNNVTGFSGWATDGIFSAYFTGEYQYAPSAAPLTDSARAVIASAQGVPVPLPPSSGISGVSQFRLLDSYFGITLQNWQFTYGKQTLWWGPGEGGAMMLSDNAAPLKMFRISRVSPFKLPSVLGWMGPMRVELFLGQLEGQNFVYSTISGLSGSWNLPVSPQPMISGEHFSFKPTRNLDFGFSLTTLFGGADVPFTAHTYLKSIFGFSNGLPGTSADPGDRRSGFDLSYRLPLLRNWATFYADGFTDDQFSPVAYWDRSAWTGGLYFSHIPKISKLDLRVEGVYTDVPAGGKIGSGFFYFNTRFRNGYSQDGVLLGSWIGRQGQGAQAWMNYWFTPKDRLQLSFRHEKVSAGADFIPGGGTITDVAVRGDVWSGPNWSISANGQYESWIFPSIQPGHQNNFSTSVQVSFRPGPIKKQSAIH